MDLEVFIKTYIDPCLPSMYYFDTVNMWVMNDISNYFILEGYNKANVEAMRNGIWKHILINKELWKSLDFMELSDYQISTFGNVKTVYNGYVTRGSKNAEGYLMTILTGAGFTKNQLAHRVSALAFWPNPENKPSVDHLDQNKENNHVLNLRWATYHEQRDNTTKTSTNKSGRPVCQYDLQGNFIKLWDNLTRASEGVKITKGAITVACRNPTRTAAAHFWRYYDDIAGDFSGEIWKDIPLPKWERYMASNMGRIKQREGRIVLGTIKKSGYVRTAVEVNGEKIREYTHRLIGYAFLDLLLYPELDINHENGRKDDNRLINLNMKDRSGNMLHAVENGLRKAIRINVLDINDNVVSTYPSINQAEKALSVSSHTIKDACRDGKPIFNNYTLKYG